MLYIVRFLHQTTTGRTYWEKTRMLYIVRFLHQTTTQAMQGGNHSPLYIVRFLHQTTTILRLPLACACCISSVSYIKPQRSTRYILFWIVVYRPFPTSNHNSRRSPVFHCQLYIVRFLHQTTTNRFHRFHGFKLYIVRFLHQTTTAWCMFCRAWPLYIVRFLHQTTTAVLHCSAVCMLYIVRFLHQTTTLWYPVVIRQELYIVRFLHQTTTYLLRGKTYERCISSVSYIKPQHMNINITLSEVVYRPFPTSNHNNCWYK